MLIEQGPTPEPKLGAGPRAAGDTRQKEAPPVRDAERHFVRVARSEEDMAHLEIRRPHDARDQDGLGAVLVWQRSELAVEPTLQRWVPHRGDGLVVQIAEDGGDLEALLNASPVVVVLGGWARIEGELDRRQDRALADIPGADETVHPVRWFPLEMLESAKALDRQQPDEHEDLPSAVI